MSEIAGSVFSIRRAGRDGFVWWFGIIEYVSTDDPTSKPGYRYKVRIVGDHTQDKDVLPTEDLPWAVVMMPVTAPYIAGNLGGSSPMLEVGNWVFGFYYDEEMQKPMIIGSIGMLPGSTTVVNYKTADPKDVSGFYTSQPIDKIDPYKDGTPPKENPQGGPNAPWNNSVGTLPTKSYGQYTKRDTERDIPPIKRLENAIVSEEWCQEVADRCGPKDVKKTLSGIFEELFYAIGNRAGTVISDSGVNVINNISGEIKNLNSTIRKYVNKTAYVIDYFISKVKGFVKEQITRAIDALIKAIIRPTPEGNILTPITKFFNLLLSQVDCAIEDLGERLAKWLADVLFGYAEEIYKSTACQVDRFTQGVLEQIYSLSDLLISEILQPLESILSIIQNPLNLLRIIDKKILDLLGISCSSPTLTCNVYQSVCTDGNRDKTDKDILDKLIDSINNAFPGQRDNTKYICDDAKNGNSKSKTMVGVIGGVVVPEDVETMLFVVPETVDVREGDSARILVKREGFIDVAAALQYDTLSTASSTEGEDYAKTDGILTFAVGETEKEISVKTYYNFSNTNRRRLFLTFRIVTPVNANNLILGFGEGRSATSILISLAGNRDGSDVNPIADLDNTYRAAKVQDSAPIQTDVREYAEDDLPVINEPAVVDPESETDELLELSTIAEEDIPELISGDPPESDGGFVIPDTSPSDEKEQVENIFDSFDYPNERFPSDPIEPTDFDEEIPIEDVIEDTPENTNIPIDRYYVSNPNDPNEIERYISISTSKRVYDTSDVILYRIYSKNIPYGTEYSYRLITSDPSIVDGSMSGKFIIDSATTIISISLKAREYELQNVLDFVIVDTTLSHSVLVQNRGSVSNARIPTLNPERRPIVIDSDKIVTDSNGGIIDIPIESPGEVLYSERPYVTIIGSGYGARAVPVLSPVGEIVEIRVIDPGLGYITNQPTDLVGVIDDFTVIRPGFDYDSENPPELIVDGERNVARAIVNDEGFVVGAQVIQRDKVYDSVPTVNIIGGGHGAKIVPSLAFITTNEYRSRLETGTRIRKGVYIDCP